MLPDRLSRMLTAYVDGELNAHQRKAVLRLLRRSPEARALLRQLQEDANELRQLPQRTLSPDFADLIMQRIADGVMKPSPYKIPTSGSPVPVSWGLAAAAAVLLAVGLGSYFLLSVLQGEKQAVRDPDPLIELARSDSRDARDVEPPAIDDAREVEPRPVVAEAVKPDKPAPLVIKKPDIKPVTPPERDDSKLVASRVEKVDEFLRPDIRLAHVQKLPEIDQPKTRRQLWEELGKGEMHHVELTCSQPGVAMERLEAAFKQQRTVLVIDDQAKTFLKLRGVQQPSYALYAENMKADEVMSILDQLNREDRKSEAARRGSGQFDGLIVSGMSARDHHLLARLMGINPAQLEAPKKELPPQSILGPKKPALDVDITKPLSTLTGEQVVRSLKGQGGRPPESSKTFAKTSERLAIVVAVGSPRAGKSQEAKLFLENRKARQPGTMQMLLILRGKS